MLTTIRFYTGTGRPKPRAGERRVTKKYGEQIRVQAMATNGAGSPIGRIVSSGRPVCEWCAPRDLNPWDRYLLTPDEYLLHFPPAK